MEKAAHWEKKGKSVLCKLCPHFCLIGEGKRGKCRVRTVKNGKLYTLSYGRPCSAGIDPIEKKPLYHFLPGSAVYSIATPGCNLSCSHCQNWEISQALPETFPSSFVTAGDVVSSAIQNNCKSIAYTYTEPTIFFEYALDIAKIAHKKKLKNVTVTNGFINPEPACELYKHIDATNIDLKGMSETFYREVCGARLQPVLDTIVQLHDMGVWVEITNLVIPTKNDSIRTIKKMCEWVVGELGGDVPFHFSRFFPCYKLDGLPATPLGLLDKAAEIARESGMKYVYIGNIPAESNTTCPECGALLVGRSGYSIQLHNVKEGKCSKCGEMIPGVWS